MLTHRVKLRAASSVTDGDTSSTLHFAHGTVGSTQIIVTSSSSPQGGAVRLEGTIDGSNWTEIAGSYTSITGDCNFLINLTGLGYPSVRAKFSLGSGSYTAEVYGSVKEMRNR